MVSGRPLWLVLVAILVSACAPASVPARPGRAARTNVLLSFAPDWTCAGWERAACEREIASELARKFAGYDAAFWVGGAARRVDGITIFFETSAPEDWGAGLDTVGYAPERCAPAKYDGVISGAAAVFRCGSAAQYGPAFCSEVVAHEIGHVLGLEHVLRLDDQMHATYRGPSYFGTRPLTTDENRCRDEQDDSALILAALGPAALE